MTITKKTGIHLIIAVSIFAILELVLPLDHGLTAAGRNFLSVFVAVAYLWITTETFVSSVVGLVVLGTLQVMPSSALFQNSFGSSIIAIVIFSSIMTIGVNECGVMKKVAQWFLSRKIIAGRPYMFFFFLGLASFVLACFIGNTYSMFCLVPLVTTVCNSIDYKKGDKFLSASLLLSMWSALAGGLGMPFGRPIYIILEGLLGGFGYTLDYTMLFRYGMLVGFLWMLAGILVIRLVIRPDLTNFRAYDPMKIREEMNANPLSRRGKLMAAGYVLMMAMWVSTVLKDSASFAAYLNAVGFHLMAAAVVVILCFVQVEGKPVIDLPKIMPKIPWGICAFGCLIMLASTAVNMESLGIKLFLIAVMKPIASGMSTITLIVIGLIITAILTNLLSNTVTIAISISVFLPMLLALTGNNAELAMGFAIMISFNAGFSCITPAAYPAATLVLGSDVDTVKALLPNCLMVLVGIILSFVIVTVM